MEHWIVQSWLLAVGRAQARCSGACIIIFIINIVVFDDLFELMHITAEVGLCAQTLRYDGDVVIEFSCIDLTLNGSHVYFLLVDHNHHLYKTSILVNIDYKLILLTCHLFLFLETPLYFDPLNLSPPMFWCDLFGLASMIILAWSNSFILIALTSSLLTSLN